MVFTKLHLGGVERRFYFDNKSKNLSNFHCIMFCESFKLKTRVRALHTRIEYSANATLSYILSSVYKDYFGLPSELGRYFMCTNHFTLSRF